MGGNIKFMSNTRRYDKDEYLELEREVMSKLFMGLIFKTVNISSNIKEFAQPIVAYYSKESFGDLDIIINSEKLSTDWIPQLVSEFGLAHGDWSKNGNVLSFAYKNLQIDLIVTTPEHYQTSLDYFAFNDCGNLQGRIAHKLGVKHGHRGAELIVKDGDREIGTILLTRDTKQIHQLLDLNHDKWREGFETLEDMYKWISNSQFFNKDIYLLDNRNHYSRTRDNKRATYSGFLEWCATQDFKNAYPHEVMTEKSGYNIREPHFSQRILPMFPHASTEYINIMLAHHDNNRFKEKFNGNIIRELIGLEDKELGAFMEWAREQIDIKNVKFMFIKYEQHVCNNMIGSLYNCYQHGWDWLEVPEEDAIKYVRGSI